MTNFVTNLIAAANAVTLETLGTDGQKVIADAVAAAETLGGDGATKFSTAVSQAGTDLLALGKDVGLFTIHLAVEAAANELNNLKAATPDSGTVSTTLTVNPADATTGS